MSMGTEFHHFANIHSSVMRPNCYKHTLGLGNGCRINALNTTTTVKYTHPHKCSGITIEDFANNNFFSKHKLIAWSFKYEQNCISFWFVCVGFLLLLWKVQHGSNMLERPLRRKPNYNFLINISKQVLRQVKEKAAKFRGERGGEWTR